MSLRSLVGTAAVLLFAGPAQVNMAWVEDAETCLIIQDFGLSTESLRQLQLAVEDAVLDVLTTSRAIQDAMLVQPIVFVSTLTVLNSHSNARHCTCLQIGLCSSLIILIQVRLLIQVGPME